MAVDRRRMVAMGGGGFGTPPGDPALDAYVLGAAGQDRPRICLLPTASGDPEEQIRRFYRRFRDLACEATHVSLFRLGTSRVDLPELLLGQDVIYVGGGSMLNLLAIWKVHGIDVLLRTAWERGVVLSGLSAGSMCWFEAGVTTSHGPPRPVRGLGWLPGSNSVHYHGEPERRPRFRAAVQDGSMPPGWGVDDGVALLFAGTELVEAVSARPSSGAWRVEPGAAGPRETPLEVGTLAPEPDQPAASVSIDELREARLARSAGPNRPAHRIAGVRD
jgi:dipeptidase E